MALSYIDKNGSIKRADVADLCRISPQQVTRLLKRLVGSNSIRSVGVARAARFNG